MPGTTLKTAQNIGILTSFNYNDAITNANPVDYYKFSLTGTNDINLVLSGVAQSYVNAFIYYDKNNNGLIDSGEQLASDFASSSRNAQLTTTLGAGNYYVGISQDSNNVNTNYSLQLLATSTPGSIPSNPGNTLNTAYNIGALTGERTFTQFVGSVDPVDYYKFSLTGTNDINLVLSGVAQSYVNAFIYYDKNNNGLIDSGEQLASDFASSSRNAQLTTTLGAGNYYVGISQDSNNVNTNYSLQLLATSTPGSIPSNPGNTLNTAYNIGALTGERTFTQFVGSVDPVDYYKFSLTGTNDINLVLSGVAQSYVNAFIYYDKNNNGLIDSGEQLASDFASSSRNAQLTTTLGAGNYYVGISQDSNNVNTNYSLQLLATSTPGSIPSNPGNTLNTAYNIGALTGERTFTQFVGSVDPVDYYKFSLTGTNDINLVLSGVAQSYVNAFIYYDKNNNGLIDSGEQLASDFASSSRNAQLTTTLGAGNYYVGISQDSNNVNSSYSLELVNITNPDPSITVALANPTSVTEDGTTNLVYTFTRTGSISNALTVNYDITGTATFNIDYTQQGAASFKATTGTITFAAGSTTKTLTINPTADIAVESNETVSLTLATGTGYAIGTTTAVTGTITNDDSASPSSAGNNTYSFVANTPLGSRTVTETTTGGTDTIDFSGTTVPVNVNLGVTTSQTVNSNLQLIISANNVIENATGGTGNDRLTGNTLNNTLIGGDGNDQLQGLAGNDSLQGGNGNDILTGGTGDDFLLGGLGDDILTGGAGKDKYLFQSSGVFNTSLGIDYITEFEAGQDQIVLSKTTFNAVTNSVGQALTDFAVVSDNQFVNASNARIVFSQSSGSLFYNRDGNLLGAGTVFEFARLGNPNITLSSNDFSLIA
ncbi:MAG: M10 family metallopeptidase C-terminal domain-containing protein [Nostoc sp.]|uniref:M10 family metallopeptidase C-terminal domain-containing protein n=1 Tax=Nostoc sp. TaxID=1180 RepID=UPI002FFA1EDC